MSTETFSGMVARVKDIEKHSPAERLGLIVGDIVLKLGQHEPLEGVEMPSLLDDLATSHDWLIIQRDTIIFRLSPAGGASGAVLEPFTLPSDVTLETAGQWKAYHCSIRPGDAMLLIPESISPIWWFIPAVAYGYFRLWQMLGANLFLYGIGYVASPIVFTVVYVSSVVIFIVGGPYMLRETAVKDGFLPRGRVAVSSQSDVAALEVATGAMLRLAQTTK
jgi:hypothetical protein